jgi:hypothetical protein
MNHVGPKGLQRISDALPHVGGSGELICRNADLCQPSPDGIVVGIKPLNLYASIGKQAGFRVHNGVFSAALLIPIVD